MSKCINSPSNVPFNILLFFHISRKNIHEEGLDRNFRIFDFLVNFELFCARDSKATTAAKARVCDKCGSVYASQAGLKNHKEGSQGRNEKKVKPTCPFSQPIPFLPSLPHPTDTRFGRTAPPQHADKFKGRKFQIFTKRFNKDGQ